MSDILRRPATMSKRNALLWGIFWMLAGAILGWYFSIVPTSVVGYTWGSTALISQVLYGVVMWASLVLPMYVAALVLNSRVGVLELSGRMLFAHMPILFLMLPAMFTDKISYSTFMSNPFNAQLSMPYIVLMTILVVVVMAWYLRWSYVAFSAVVKRSGCGVVALFGVAILLSYMLSGQVLEWDIYNI